MSNINYACFPHLPVIAQHSICKLENGTYLSGTPNYHIYWKIPMMHKLTYLCIIGMFLWQRDCIFTHFHGVGRSTKTCLEWSVVTCTHQHSHQWKFNSQNIDINYENSVKKVAMKIEKKNMVLEQNFIFSFLVMSQGAVAMYSLSVSAQFIIWILYNIEVGGYGSISSWFIFNKMVSTRQAKG